MGKPVLAWLFKLLPDVTPISSIYSHHPGKSYGINSLQVSGEKEPENAHPARALTALSRNQNRKSNAGILGAVHEKLNRTEFHWHTPALALHQEWVMDTHIS